MSSAYFVRVMGLVILAAWLAGCAYPISNELQREASPKLPFPLVKQAPNDYLGATVIWGGFILNTVNYQDSTDLIILETQLDYTQEPTAARHSRGRFIIRSRNFLDPEIYKPGLRVTVAGKILGSQSEPLDQGQYTYPILSVKQLYLWRAQRDRVNRHPYYNNWPGFNWWGPPPPPRW
jgi:outer membrane lipoprotein